MRESKQDGDRLFSVVSCDRTILNRQKLKCGKFHLNIGEKAFYCEGGQTLQQVVQGGCEVSILGGIHIPNGCGPEQPALVDTALNKNVFD